MISGHMIGLCCPKTRLFPTHSLLCLFVVCQDLLYSMYSAPISIVVTCLLFTPLGPEPPPSEACLATLCPTLPVSPLWWNTVLFHHLILGRLRKGCKVQKLTTR